MLKSPPSLNPTDVVFNVCAAKMALCASIILKILIKVSQRSMWLTLDEQFDQTIFGLFLSHGTMTDTNYVFFKLFRVWCSNLRPAGPNSSTEPLIQVQLIRTKWHAFKFLQKCSFINIFKMIAAQTKTVAAKKQQKHSTIDPDTFCLIWINLY